MKKIILIIVITAMFLGGCAPSALMTKEIQPENIGVIVVDMQGDFTEYHDGSLAVANTGKAFVDKVKKATFALRDKGYFMVATQDWHPADHISFYTNHTGKEPFETIEIEGRTQVLWPPHCVMGTSGAHVLIDNSIFKAIVKKGKDKRYDSYSGFRDDGGADTEMDQILKANGIKELFVYGIATDYCVKATAVDAANAGYEVTVVEGLTRGVAPDSTQKALDEMRQMGITIIKELE